MAMKSQAPTLGNCDQPVVPTETSHLLYRDVEGVSWKPTVGDINCFFALLMNNIGTVIVSAKMGKMIFDDAFGPGLKATNTDHIVFGTIIPGMVPTIVMGCVYYAWMTYRILKKAPAGTKMTVLPYGINTPAALCFIFSIMMPAIKDCAHDVQDGKMTPNDAVKKAWSIGVVANFVGGAISMLFALFGPTLVKITPPAALMIALAGIGFTWLGINPLLDCFSFASCGMVTLVVGMMLQLNIIKTGVLPPATVLLIIGTCVGWMSGVPWLGGGTWEEVKQSVKVMQFALPVPIGSDVLGVIPDVLEKYIGVILPVAFTGAIGTLLNVSGAERAGDPYPLAETLFIDGLTTCISALFGSPYGTCVYIGHSQFKEMGGRLVYPILFSVAFTVLAVGGCFGLISSLVPPYAISPILVFIGLMIVTDAMSTAPVRHLPACIFGLFPAVAELIVNNQWLPTQGQESPSWWGLQSIAQGSLLLSTLWTCIFVSIIDSEFAQAFSWCLGAAACSAVGLIHQSSVDLQFKSFTKSSYPFPADHIGTQPVSLTIGYTSLAMLFGVLWVIQHTFPHSRIVGRPYSMVGERKEVAEEVTEEIKRLSFLVDEGRRISSFIPNPEASQPEKVLETLEVI